ncbi:gas vesicle protein GvpL [Haloferacaceae archaeon DSL9]
MTDIDDGRYLYCIVAVTDAEATLSTTGVDGEPIDVVVEDGLGAVVHRCDELYDSSDPQRIQRWLLQHQGVVDAAADAFGTPLPCRFDTIFTGGTERIRSWLRSEEDDLRAALAALADKREYRIEVSYDGDRSEAELAETDERLASLSEQIEAASEGKGYLLQKQYESRLRELQRTDEAAIAERVTDAIDPHIAERVDLGGRKLAALTEEMSDDGTAEPVARFAVLARESDADELGDALDPIAAQSGVTIRFTGPWPPYTFTPTIGENHETTA